MSFKINGCEIHATIFPDHTSQIWKLSEVFFGEYIVINIEWDFHHEGEIMHLAQIADLFRFQEKNLYISYLPYARQDKVIANDKTFALLTFSKILNNMDFASVKILDAHSNVCDLIINKYKEVKPTEYIDNTLMILKPDVICFPDKGAATRYSWISFPNKVFAEKTRNQLTGELTGCILHGEVKDKNVLIVDDICDGGGTFVACAKTLKEAGAKSINLYTTHGLYTKGLSEMKKAGITRFFSKKGEALYTVNYFNSMVYRPFKEIK